MLESAVSKGFGGAGAKAWMPHVVLVYNYRTANPVPVDPDQTPADLGMVPNREPPWRALRWPELCLPGQLDIPYKISLLAQPRLPGRVHIAPASIMRRLVLTHGEVYGTPWPGASSQPVEEPTSAEEGSPPHQPEVPGEDEPADLLLGRGADLEAADLSQDLESLLLGS
eukprot:TRINITY_DN14237_c0_g2_i1.p1 TRINITY_DN14237_c0_g2~~TRINITY_DN14237_c0_g2_i1.p1  ORF type:complete len:169 (-),score=15.54 TRINITY_DN14237_c0_g2_i1:110-616(-)